MAQKVTVLGAGVLGSQIMMQAAYHGKDVVGYDVSQEALDQLPARWEWMRGYYIKDVADYTPEKFDAAIARISSSTQLSEAVAEADIVIESIVEDINIKKSVWEEVGKAAPTGAILATNTSSLLPSSFGGASGRPQDFLALHFANLVWKSNTGEVMRTPDTSDEAFDATVKFAEEIGLVPIPIYKETPGYVLNRLLIPFLDAGAELYIDGISNPADIDNTWKIATGSPRGPFEIYDVVGFGVASHVSKNSADPRHREFAQKLEESIARGETGIATGKGFYIYKADGQIDSPNPAWEL